jgi:hypothetical protein
VEKVVIERWSLSPQGRWVLDGEEDAGVLRSGAEYVRIGEFRISLVEGRRTRGIRIHTADLQVFLEADGTITAERGKLQVPHYARDFVR